MLQYLQIICIMWACVSKFPLLAYQMSNVIDVVLCLLYSKYCWCVIIIIPTVQDITVTTEIYAVKQQITVVSEKGQVLYVCLRRNENSGHLGFQNLALYRYFVLRDGFRRDCGFFVHR